MGHSHMGRIKTKRWMATLSGRWVQGTRRARKLFEQECGTLLVEMLSPLKTWMLEWFICGPAYLSFPFWAQGAWVTIPVLNSMRSSLWKAQLENLLLLAQFKVTIQSGFQFRFGSEETPGMLYFYSYLIFACIDVVPAFSMFLKDKVCFPAAVTNCHLDFSLSPFLSAWISCPCRAPSPVSHLKVTSSALAGAAGGMPSSQPGCLPRCGVDGQEIPAVFNSSLTLLASKRGTFHYNSVSRRQVTFAMMKLSISAFCHLFKELVAVSLLLGCASSEFIQGIGLCAGGGQGPDPLHNKSHSASARFPGLTFTVHIFCELPVLGSSGLPAQLQDVGEKPSSEVTNELLEEPQLGICSQGKETCLLSLSPRETRPLKYVRWS